MHYRDVITARIDYIQAELAALAALVRIEEPVASVVAAPILVAPAPAPEPLVVAEPEPVAVEVVPHVEELPPEPKGKRGRRAAIDFSSFTLDPAQAATILDVARQTVDARLKKGMTGVPGGPVDTSKGDKRARWRWASEDDVRRWWAAVK